MIRNYPLPGRVPEFQNARETGRVHQARGLYPGVRWAHERCGGVHKHPISTATRGEQAGERRPGRLERA